MTQETIKIFGDEIDSKGLQQNYITNKTDFYHIDDIWSLDIVDLRDNCPANNREYVYVSVVIVNFSKSGWAVAIRNKNAITKTNSSENIHITAKKPNLTKTDDGNDFVHKILLIY